MQEDKVVKYIKRNLAKSPKIERLYFSKDGKKVAVIVITESANANLERKIQSLSKEIADKYEQQSEFKVLPANTQAGGYLMA